MWLKSDAEVIGVVEDIVVENMDPKDGWVNSGDGRELSPLEFEVVG